jgi:hypothetical protein
MSLNTQWYMSYDNIKHGTAGEAHNRHRPAAQPPTVAACATVAVIMAECMPRDCHVQNEQVLLQA